MNGLSHELHVNAIKLLCMPNFSVLFSDLRLRDCFVIPRVRTKYGERLRTFYVTSVLNSSSEMVFS